LIFNASVTVTVTVTVTATATIAICNNYKDSDNILQYKTA